VQQDDDYLSVAEAAGLLWTDDLGVLDMASAGALDLLAQGVTRTSLVALRDALLEAKRG
jgi:hypothetical protein